MYRSDLIVGIALLALAVCGAVEVRLYQLGLVGVVEMICGTFPFFAVIIMYLIIKRVLRNDAHR